MNTHCPLKTHLHWHFPSEVTHSPASQNQPLAFLPPPPPGLPSSPRSRGFSLDPVRFSLLSQSARPEGRGLPVNRPQDLTKGLAPRRSVLRKIYYIVKMNYRQNFSSLWRKLYLMITDMRFIEPYVCALRPSCQSSEGTSSARGGSQDTEIHGGQATGLPCVPALPQATGAPSREHPL